MISGNIALRVPILYGQVEYIEESAVTVMLKPTLDHSKQQVIDDYQRFVSTVN